MPEMSKTEPREDLRERALKFALGIIEMTKALPSEIPAREVTRQVVRSATSIGANLEEAFAGLSKKDFIHSVNIARKESNETRYWLRIIAQSNWSQKPVDVLLSESEAWVKILTAIVKKHQKRVVGSNAVLSLIPFTLSLFSYV
jgi:four helix bundle protein